jgi:hypothetical protein
MNNLTTNIFEKFGDSSHFLKLQIENIFKKFPLFFKGLVINTQSIIISIIVLIILTAIFYLLFRLYKLHPRAFSTSNYLKIAGKNDKKPQQLDIIFYSSLSKSLAYYVYDNDLPMFNNVFNKNLNKQIEYLKFINSQIFFHKNTKAYTDLNNFKVKYNQNIYNKNWGLQSIEGLQTFFYDILTENFKIPKEYLKINKNILNNSKKELIDLLKINKNDFDNNLKKVVNDNVYSFISVYNYINNNPQNDYILNNYGKFIKVKVLDNEELYLKQIFNIPSGELNDILSYNSDTSENTIINNKINELIKEFDDINSEVFESHIFRIINGSPDPSDFNTYMIFVKDFGTTGNKFVDSILQLKGIKNNKINLTRQQTYNYDLLTSNQREKILIYQDIIVYQYFKKLLNNYSKIITDSNIHKILINNCNWHLERLAYSKYFDGEFIIRVFNNDQITRFNRITSDIFDLINFPLYKSEMSYGLFAVLYIYLSQDSVNERLKHLSEYYISFSDLYLNTNNLDEFEKLKKKRDHINLFEDFLLPALKYFFVEQIYGNQIKGIIWEDKYKEIAPIWNKLRNTLKSGTTYFDCSNKKFSKLSFCKKQENFVEDFKNFNGDIIEEFNIGNIFKPILKPITTIVDVAVNFGKIIMVIIDSAKDPMKTFKIIIGLILWLVAQAVFIPLDFPIKPFSSNEKNHYPDFKNKTEFGQYTITLGRLIMSVLYRLFYSLPVAVFNSSILFALLLTRVITVVIIVILDFLTNKKASKLFYKWFLACENSPFAWYENSFYQKGNKNERDLVCKKNCSDGYKLTDDGNKCEKIPNYIPNYCPQAQLMRIYKGLKISGPISLKEFSPPMGLNQTQIDEYIENYKKYKKDYYESCQNLNMVQYDDIAKSICSNMEFAVKNGMSQNDIKDICYNKFCKNGNHESFCTKLNEFQYTNNNSFNTSKSDVIKTASGYCLIIVVLTTIIYCIDKKINFINEQI